jgi:programmed cell death protein 5
MSGIPSDVAPSEIPDGFSLADPTGHVAAGGGPKQNEAAAQRDAQRQAILEQAMTPDALARLRRVKVRELLCCTFYSD